MDSPKDIIFIGAGGHARSVLEAMPDDRLVAGYIDLKDCPGIRRSDGMELQRLGDDASNAVPEIAMTSDLIITLVSGATCSFALRSRIIDKYSQCTFAIVVAPTAYVAHDVKIGNGTTVMHRVCVNCGSEIGMHAVINTGAILEHDCRLGSNVFIGPGAVLCGGVTIGNNVFVGANATVKPCVKICSDVVIGLGSAVLNDITEPGTYAGVPAKRIC